MKYFAKHVFALFLITLFLSVIVNVSVTTIHRRGGIGSRHVGMEKSAQTIVQDLYNQSFDNSFFFAITEHSGDGKYIPCKFSTNLSLSQVTLTNSYFLSIVRPITDENIRNSLSKQGFVYIISSFELPMNTYRGMQLVKKINSCDSEDSYFCRLKEFIKKQKQLSNIFKEQLNQEPKFFVYKIVKKKILYQKPVTILCNGKDGLPDNKL